MEGLKADSRALSTLVGVAQGDLRGCLNALQVRIFLAQVGLVQILSNVIVLSLCSLSERGAGR